MTENEAIYCLKADSESHSEVCEECNLHGLVGCDHCQNDAIEVAIKALEEVQQYRALGTVEKLTDNMEELKRWHTDKIAPNVKNPFAYTSTLICHNCDHKDDYIEELESEVAEYRAIGEISTCRVAVEICRAMIERGIEPENIEAYIAFEDKCVQKGFTIKGLLEAGEKQTAKKPYLQPVQKNECREDECWECPSCDSFLGYEVDCRDDHYRENYCPYCGQKLDWER